MKIRLTVDLPIDSTHEAVKGRSFTVHRVELTEESPRHEFYKYYFCSETGDECAAFGSECVLESGLPSSLKEKLGSIAVHVDEYLSDHGHPHDRAAIESLLADPEISEWISGMNEIGLLPLKRNH